MKTSHCPGAPDRLRAIGGFPPAASPSSYRSKPGRRQAQWIDQVIWNERIAPAAP